MADAKLTDAARDARNAYQRAWRAKNKDKVRENNQRYWAKKAAEMAVSDKGAEENENEGN